MADESSDDNEEDVGEFEQEPQGECMDWGTKIAEAAVHAQVYGLRPRGLRLKGEAAKLLEGKQVEEPSDSVDVGTLSAGMRAVSATRRDVFALGFLLALIGFTTFHFCVRQVVPAAPYGEAWRRDCHQCTREWWQQFWSWRLAGINSSAGDGLPHAPPEGMEWEWGDAKNDTDWFGASAQLVNEVVREYADPGVGPALHVGCGDSPLPGLLYHAGFRNSEHLDVAPQVIQALRERYPPADWPGMNFTVRDFLASSAKGGGPPPPLHRFGTVIDKAGIWDWLLEEAEDALPLLLTAVRDALVAEPDRGVYILATKQTPAELSKSLNAATRTAKAEQDLRFSVDVSRPLGSRGIAWAYVLAPL